jgi:metal-responsive CopG/Arc/MetJ family transcriptional regulator
MTGMVGISVYLDFTTLNAVENEFEGKNRSEKIRRAIELGLKKQNLRSKAAIKQGHGT